MSVRAASLAGHVERFYRRRFADALTANQRIAEVDVVDTDGGGYLLIPASPRRPLHATEKTPSAIQLAAFATFDPSTKPHY